MVPCDNPVIRLEPGRKVDYKKIQRENGLEDHRDIVWMKFTRDGYMGVVAVSNDIGFDIPSSCEEYNQKIQYKSSFRWKFYFNSFSWKTVGRQLCTGFPFEEYAERI